MTKTDKRRPDHSLLIGDRVEGGTPDTDDYDTGTVDSIHEGNQVTVRWDSLVVTTQDASLLRRLN